MAPEHGNPIGELLAAVICAASRGNDTAMATGQVAAKRAALGLDASRHSGSADREEFGRMIPEKAEAFSAAGKIILEPFTRRSGSSRRLRWSREVAGRRSV